MGADYVFEKKKRGGEVILLFWFFGLVVGAGGGGSFVVALGVEFYLACINPSGDFLLLLCKI